jgi:hypothetical protein
MTITIDRKRKESIEVFPTIDDFIKLLKNEYNNINFENDDIKSSIITIYNQLLTEEGNVNYLRFSRWLPKKFGFKHSNKFSLPFWLERGFTEKEYKSYTDDIFKERSNRLTKYAKDLSDSLFIYEQDYSNIYKFNTNTFKLDKKPNCNLCNSELILKKSEKNNIKVYLIMGCSNKECESKSNSKDVKWRAFLPEDKYNELKNNLKEVKRSFSKEFWIKKGYTEKEAINKVFEIQSSNSKKFKGKRTGKSKDKLKEKGYTDEEIRITCLSRWNLEYWIRRGLTEEEASKRVYEIQSYAAKHVDYEKRLLPSNLEYWLNKGFSESESKKKVTESQTTFSKDICIEKWGYKKGIEIFNKRQDKWFKSLKDNKNIFIGYSKISQELFKKIETLIDGDFLYAEKGGELKIKKEKGGYYFYDFTDVKNKKIIEYNGDMYHANPSKYESNEYPHPFRKNITAEEIWNKDLIKIKTAEEIGYEVLVIWDSEYRYKGLKNKEFIIQKCINFLKS